MYNGNAMIEPTELMFDLVSVLGVVISFRFPEFELPVHLHSARRAAIGLTRVALHPGPNAAPSAVISSTTDTRTKLTGSVGLTPTSMLSTNRANAMLNATPITIPRQAILVSCPSLSES